MPCGGSVQLWIWNSTRRDWLEGTFGSAILPVTPGVSTKDCPANTERGRRRNKPRMYSYIGRNRYLDDQGSRLILSGTLFLFSPYAAWTPALHLTVPLDQLIR